MTRDTRDRLIDIGTRLLALGYFGTLCWLALQSAIKVAPAVVGGTASDADLRTLLVKATAVAFSGLLVWVYLFRSRPVRKSRGLLPRVTALLNAVILPAAMVLPVGLRLLPSTASTTMAVTGFVLVGVGHLGAAIVLGFLGGPSASCPRRGSWSPAAPTPGSAIRCTRSSCSRWPASRCRHGTG